MDQVVTDLSDFFDSIVAVLPLLIQNFKNLSKNVKATVNLVFSFKDLDGDHVKANAEARAVCHELLKMVSYSNTYMTKVDRFAWYAKRKSRHNLVLRAVQKNRGTMYTRTRPVKEYISQLTQFLTQTEEGYQNFQKSFRKVMKRLDAVFEECVSIYNESEERSQELATSTLVACGIAIGSGAGLAANMGIGSMFMLCIATAVGITATFGAMTNGYQSLQNAIKKLVKNVAAIKFIALSIQSAITDVCIKLKGIRTIIDDVELWYEMPEFLIEHLQILFGKFVEVGTACSNCRQNLTYQEKVLKTAIDDLYS